MRGRGLGWVLFTAKLETIVKPTIITFNKDWGGTIPEWLIERIRTQRFLEYLRELNGEVVEEASDEEAFTYLYTASLTIPLDRTWARIFLYLSYKLFGKKVEDLNPPKELSEYEQHLLIKLKRYLYGRRRARERERIKEIIKELVKNEEGVSELRKK